MEKAEHAVLKQRLNSSRVINVLRLKVRVF